ncbi:MAG: beta-N-acetylhexosaminidase [Sphingobacteriales bacterium]|nr:MAG: beta-N-acetylhexosaminidase [Sphingobacteriales bacterium]
MKIILFFCLQCIIGLSALCQNISLIPQPVSLVKGNGSFVFPATITIAASNDPDIIKIQNILATQIEAASGKSVQTLVGKKASLLKGISLEVVKDASIPKEGYRLRVNAAGVSLTATSASGIFYGVQTLLQLFPKEIESKTAISNVAWKIPFVTIEDHPRFGWRGVMLDVVRHWFTIEQVKDFMDDMVRFKFNMLHLHLSDDQGWRIEIKSLPKLTEVGAWRADRVGRWGDFTKPTADEPKTYGGYYTQEDMKELIAYAKERYITIMPEIDVPGHSLAAVASYPELTCTTDSTYQVNAGERFMIWPGNGTFYGILDNTLCPANEKVYEFLDKVFTEIAAIFPYEYIHMGGDECYKGFWEKSEAVKQLMQRENLNDMHEVQSYFVKRVQKIINSKGKKMMGWDEIMEGGLASGASVMSWQGMKGGTAAAKAKHHVVMSPNDFAYVDLYQGDPIAEPPTYSKVLLKKSYEFNPLPPGVDSQYILGGQANLWAERLHTVRHMQYMLWPRTLAIAESVWSPTHKKNWPDFVKRVEYQFERFDVAETNYSRSMYDPAFIAKKDANGQLLIEMTTQIEGLSIHYSFDEFPPDRFYPVYSKPLSVPKDAANLKVITYRGKEQVGKPISMPVAELKKRAKIN